MHNCYLQKREEEEGNNSLRNGGYCTCCCSSCRQEQLLSFQVRLDDIMAAGWVFGVLQGWELNHSHCLCSIVFRDDVFLVVRQRWDLCSKLRMVQQGLVDKYVHPSLQLPHPGMGINQSTVMSQHTCCPIATTGSPKILSSI